LNSGLHTYLIQGLQALQLELSTSQHSQLLAYLNLLAKWNQTYNLTAVRDLETMVPKHVLDSLAVLPYVRGPRILDVGTGAGLPGLVLAIAAPQWQFVLLDRQQKKTRFVKQAIIELQLTHVEVVCQRVERFKPQALFDTIISRAYSELYPFYQQTRALCAPQGQLLAMKGHNPHTEIAALNALSLQVNTISVTIPQLAAQRHVIQIQ